MMLITVDGASSAEHNLCTLLLCKVLYKMGRWHGLGHTHTWAVYMTEHVGCALGGTIN